MLPQIRRRLYTEEKYLTLKNKQRSLMVKPRTKKYLNIGASMPYIMQLADSSLVNTPQKYNLNSMNKKRTNTLAVSRGIQSQQRSFLFPQQIKTYSIKTRKYTQQSQPKKGQIKKGAQAKIQHILNLFQSRNKTLEDSSIKQIKKSRSTKYDKYEEEFRKLPMNKQKWNNDKISSFIQILIEINPFFKKINSIVTVCLFRIGKVKKYQQNEIIQREDYPMVHMGIVLWGQILLKNSNSPMKMYLFPGDSINQELLFPNNDKKSYDKIYCRKGFQSIKQSGKAKTNAGILYFKVEQYKTIYQELVKIGQKSNTLVVQNMMKWSYSKKKGLRKQFSHL